MTQTIERLNKLAEKALDELESRELVTLSSKQLLTMIKLINEIQQKAAQAESEDDWLDELYEEVKAATTKGPRQAPPPGLTIQDIKEGRG